MPSTQRTRAPKQRRSEQTRARIIETGRRLFCADGYHATSSKKIAHDAGVAIGSFYNYFSDKKELLMEIYRLHIQEMREVIAESFGRIDPASMDGFTLVRSIIEQVRKIHRLSPDLHRVITVLILTDDDFAQLGRHEEERVMAMLEQLLDGRPVRVTDLTASVRVMVLSIEAVIHSMVMSPEPLDEGRLMDALTDMVQRCLFEPAGDVPSTAKSLP